MWSFLPFACLFVFVTSTLDIFEGTCRQKDPSPGVLVLTPGQELIMTCRGQVMIDGLKVRKDSHGSRRGASQSGVVGETRASMKSWKQDVVNDANTGNGSYGDTASPSTRVVPQTTSQRLSKAREVHQETEGDQEDEWDEESRLVQRENSSLQWMWTGRMVGKRGKDVRWSRGATLALPSVTVSDSGTFTCYHSRKERFSVKVIVADPPQKPDLLCYKKSPSSKIRCESKPQQNVTIRPNCYLLLSKSAKDPFLPFQCSFSSRTSRCFCVLDHNEDEVRWVHFAYLCITSIAGNTTSILQTFTPMGILKPDPPTNVSVRKVEGKETWINVTWKLPSSWKSHDDFYDLIYQIKYKPAASSFHSEQIHNIGGKRFFLIRDAIPAEEYLVQVRTKEEYDGLWSNWSTAVHGYSWTAEKLTATTISIYADIESSGNDFDIVDVPPTFTTVPTQFSEVSAHILWISISFVALSIILAIYIFRQRDKFLSKIQSLTFVPARGASSQPLPSAPPAPEGWTLVAFAPPSYREHPEDAHEKQELCQNGRGEALNSDPAAETNRKGVTVFLQGATLL